VKVQNLLLRVQSPHRAASRQTGGLGEWMLRNALEIR
jgi:hypothetical protein